jgi:hypothetical protein
MNYFYRPNFHKLVIRSVYKEGVKKLTINKKRLQVRHFSQMSEDPKTDPPPKWLLIYGIGLFTWIQILHIL